MNSNKKKTIQELDVYFNNTKKIPQENNNNYIVEFNNEKKVKVNIKFNNQFDINKSEIKNEKEEDYAQVSELNQNQEIIISDNDNINNFNTNINATYDEYNTNITNIINQEQIITQRTLPTIVKEKVNKVIYDSNIKTLPLIYGGTKVTYSNNNEDLNYSNYDNNYNYNIDTNDLNLESKYQINKTQTQVITRKLPSENYYSINPVQTYTTVNPTQSYIQEYPTQNYTETNLSQSYSYNNYNQENQTNQGEQYYGNLQPLYQSYNFEEYRKTNY